jgi:hypothetical protein
MLLFSLTYSNQKKWEIRRSIPRFETDEVEKANKGSPDELENKKLYGSTSEFITVETMNCAEKSLISYVQKRHFHEELEY